MPVMSAFFMRGVGKYCSPEWISTGANASGVSRCVGDGSKVENRDGSKVNSDKLKGKMAEDVGPYQIGRFLKDPDFGLRVIKDGYGLFKGWSNFVGSAFEFNGMIYGDFSGRSQGEMQVEEG
jgi:hypothetical protein